MIMANNARKKSLNTKIAGLTVLEIFFYIIGMPLLIALAASFCVELYMKVPYYTFWPFVGVILAGVLCLVFFIVVLCVTRKKSRRTIRRQTMALIITVLCLTFLVGALVDVVLPDILTSMTSGTLTVEDVENNFEEQGETNAFLVRRFVMSNMVNGNYDAKYAYETVTDAIEEGDPFSDDEAYLAYNDYKQMLLGWAAYSSDEQQANYDALVESMSSLQKELYDFIYTNWVMRDPVYMLMSPDAPYGNMERHAVALGMSEYLLPEYERLSTTPEGGMADERIRYLFNKNYASMDNDGYVTYDDNLILYAQASGRMTVPVVIRLILDKSSDFSEGSRATLDKDNNLVYPTYETTDDRTGITSIYFEKYMADEVVELFANHSAALVKVNNYEGTYYVDPAYYEDNDVFGILAGAVINNIYYDEDGVTVKGGYVSQPMKWGILDMDGKTMAVTSLDLDSLLSGLLPDLSVTELINMLNNALANAEGGLFGSLLDGLAGVLYEATAGRPLALGLCINDSGLLQINIYPTNVEKGLLGYQDMTWLESNNLLVAVISVMSLRNWLYIIGAISIVTVLAASCCREFKARMKKDFEEREKQFAAAEAAAAGGEAPVEAYEATGEYAPETYPEDAAPVEATEGYPEDAAPVEATEGYPEDTAPATGAADEAVEEYPDDPAPEPLD